jgi:hypothetical protein
MLWASEGTLVLAVAAKKMAEGIGEAARQCRTIASGNAVDGKVSCAMAPERDAYRVGTNIVHEGELKMRNMVIAVALFGLVASAALAQTTATQNVTIGISEINQLAATTGGLATFSITNAAAAGDQPTITATANTAGLSYTSILPAIPGTKLRKINAQITTALPLGLQLSAVANTLTGTGKVGVAAGGGLLNGSTAVDLVTGIGSCYTKAPKVVYTLGIIPADVDKLEAVASATAVVTYTMTAAQ